jgi:ribonuclease Z
MHPFELTILGCSSATPTSERFPTAQVLQVAGRFFLIDCGEGTQMQIRRYSLRFQKINHIFISHLHGDHYFGLMGLISSMHLLGRKHELKIYSQAELKEIVELQFKYSYTQLNYPISWRSLSYDSSQVLYEDEKLTVETIILNHRIPTCGFLFREKPSPRKLIKEKLEMYKVSIEAMHHLKNGEDYITTEGKVIPNKELTEDAPRPRSYAYCSDTRYREAIVDQIKGVDLLYHEATFLHDRLERAKETYHSTAKEAATIAKMAGVKQLVLGHYSARYIDLQPFLDEARAVFANTLLGREGEVYSIPSLAG